MLCSDWLSDSTLDGHWLYFSDVKNAIREADWTYQFYLQGLLPKILAIKILMNLKWEIRLRA